MKLQPYNLTDYTNGFLNLLPQGYAWNKEPGSNMYNAVQALMNTYVRTDISAINLLADAFPSTAVFLLPEWEYTLGLPDHCVIAGTQTISERQRFVVAKLANTISTSVSGIIQFCSNLGYTVTITEIAPLRADVSIIDDTTSIVSDTSNVWYVNAPATTANIFDVNSSANDYLATYGTNILQCELDTIKPAQSYVVVNT